MPTYLEKQLAATLQHAFDFIEGVPTDPQLDAILRSGRTGRGIASEARTVLALVDAITGPLRICDRVRIVPNDTRRFRSLSDRQGVVTGMTHYGFTVRFPGDPSRYRTSIPREYLQRLPATAATLQAVQP